MIAEFHPMPWSNFIQECYFYMFLASIIQVALFLIGCLILYTLSVFSKKQRPPLQQSIGRFAIFNVLLLIVGALFNGVWSCTIWGRFYDSADYFVDFTPFWPITQRVIDMPFGNERGRLLGISLFQLQLIWFAFALGTWTTTIYLYKWLERKRAADAPNLTPLTTDH